MSHNAASSYPFDYNREWLHDSDKNMLYLRDGLWSKMNEHLKNFDYGSKSPEFLNELLSANKLSASLHPSNGAGFGSTALNAKTVATSPWSSFTEDRQTVKKNGESADCWKSLIGEQNDRNSWHKNVVPSSSQIMRSSPHLPQNSGVDNGTALWRQSLRSPSPDQNSLNAFLNHVSSIQTKSVEPSYQEVNLWKTMHQVPMHGAQPKTRKIPQSRSELIKKLMDIGFQKDEAQAALIHSNMDMTLALVKLLSNQRKYPDANPTMIAGKPDTGNNSCNPYENICSYASTSNAQQGEVKASTPDTGALGASLNKLSIREFIPGQLWTSAKSNPDARGSSSTPSPKTYVSHPDEFTYGMVNDTWMASESHVDDTSAWVLGGESIGTSISNYTDGMYRYGWSLGNDKDEFEFQNSF